MADADWQEMVSNLKHVERRLEVCRTFLSAPELSELGFELELKEHDSHAGPGRDIRRAREALGSATDALAEAVAVAEELHLRAAVAARNPSLSAIARDLLALVGVVLLVIVVVEWIN